MKTQILGALLAFSITAPALARAGYTAFIADMYGNAKTADDPFLKKEQYVRFEGDLKAAKADYNVITYPGAVHAFTNPEATALGKKFNLPLR